MMVKKRHTSHSEFRKDIVSGDWVIVATGRGRRPHAKRERFIPPKYYSKKGCPFEDPQKSGNPKPIIWYPYPDDKEAKKGWFIQIIPNKYPILSPQDLCPVEDEKGPTTRLEGMGFHEVVITRDHTKTIADMRKDEVELLIKSYQERYIQLQQKACVEYILIFHNHGPEAGASISHPHSQIIALPIIPPDVSGSLEGSRKYFKKYGDCVHCKMLEWEKKQKARVVFENKHFIVLVPFAARTSFETRIYPKIHTSHFEFLNEEELPFFADALGRSLGKIKKAMDNPDYNFFIHTAPAKARGMHHYHWHLEILPRLSEWAGLELGADVQVVSTSPEQAASILKKTKV